MSEEIPLQQKFEKFEKYHNDTGFLTFLSAEAGKGVSNVDYDIELAVLFLYILNGREEEDKIKGDDRNIAVEALYYAMGLYEAEMQAKKEAAQKMMPKEEAGSIQEKLEKIKAEMPSLNELSDTAKAEVQKMKGKLDEGKEAAKAKIAQAAEAAQAKAAEAMKSIKFPSFSGGKRRSKKNKSKKNKSKKSKKSRK